MPAPQDLIDMLNGLQADADETAAKSQAKMTADQAAENAAAAAVAAGHDLTAAQQHQATDLEATVAKLRSSYGLS